MCIYCRVEKVNAQVITRSRTGNLPVSLRAAEPIEIGSKILVSSKATVEEIKEKMEQQLRQQRAAHQQKRALEMKNSTQIMKLVGNATQGKIISHIFYFIDISLTYLHFGVVKLQFIDTFFTFYI